MPVSGPQRMASWPSLSRCSSSRAKVRVTPSTFGKKFSASVQPRMSSVKQG